MRNSAFCIHKNKCAKQLQISSIADLHLCFGFIDTKFLCFQYFKVLTIFYGSTPRFVSTWSVDRFSCDTAETLHKHVHALCEYYYRL